MDRIKEETNNCIIIVGGFNTLFPPTTRTKPQISKGRGEGAVNREGGRASE